MNKSTRRAPNRPPRGPHHRGPGNSAPSVKRRAARLAEDEPPELVVEICIVDGPEGERLAQQQARVLWEVTEWLARNNSEHGPGHIK